MEEFIPPIFAEQKFGGDRRRAASKASEHLRGGAPNSLDLSFSFLVGALVAQ
jgi:hypothetical protein